jgi:hypothetical protein
MDAGLLERLGRKVFAVKCDDAAVAALGIVALLKLELEVDGADDAVAEILVNERLEGRGIDLDHLVETIHGGVGRHAAGKAATDRDRLEQVDVVSVEAEDLADCFGCARRQGCCPSSAAVTNSRERPLLAAMAVQLSRFSALA